MASNPRAGDLGGPGFGPLHWFDKLLEVQVLIGDWKLEYNNYRPHSCLGWLPPSRTVRLGRPRTKWTDSHKTVDLRLGSGNTAKHSPGRLARIMAARDPRRGSGA